MSNFTPLKGDCPICNGAGKRCTQSQTYDITKYTTGLVFCADKTADHPDWRFLHPDPHTGFHIWAYRNGRITDPITSERFRKQQSREKQAQLRRKQEKIKNSLPLKVRDREIRKLLSCLTLENHHRQLLSSRGLTDKQNAKNGYRSVRKWQKLSTYIDPGLGGSNRKGSGLNNFNSGILCPVINEDGLYVGLRINHLNPKDGEGKYVWISSSERGVDNKIPISNSEEENPIAVHFPDEAGVQGCRGAEEQGSGGAEEQGSRGASFDRFSPAPKHPSTPAQKPPKYHRIGICEGLEYKAAIAANKLGFPVIGTAGCNFHKSPQLLIRAIEKINPHAEIVIIPDAGANPYVAGSYLRALQTFGYLREEEQGRVGAGEGRSNGATEQRSGGAGEHPSTPAPKHPCTQAQELRLPNLKIAWWEQYGKHHGDIDEIPDDVTIKLLTPQEFAPILKRLQNPNTQKWIESREFTPDLVINQRYFTAEVPAENTIFSVKSGLGTGKTYQLNQWVKKLQDEHGFLLLGYRNTLLEQFCANNGFYHIHDEQSPLMRMDDMAQHALCVDSLAKFAPEDFDGKGIILDEIMSVIPHLFQSKTIESKGNKTQIVNLFNEAIKRANRVICLDGNLADYMSDYLHQICPEKKVLKIENKFQQKRQVFFYKGSISSKGKINNRDKSGIISKLLKSRRPAVVSDSQTACEALDELLTSQGYKTLRIDSTTSGESYAKEFLADCDAYLEKHQPDMVIISPSGESGLDISINNYFTDLFVLAYGVLGVNSILQISRRIRDNNVPIHIWANNSLKPKSNRQKLEELFDDAKQFAIDKGIYSEDREAIEKAFSDYLATVAAANHNSVINQLNEIEEYEKDGINYEWCLRYALREQGLDVADGYAQSSRHTKKAYSEAREIVLRTRATNIFDAPDLTEEQLKRPLKNGATGEEKFARIKASLKKYLPGIELEEIWESEFIYQTQFNHPQYLKQINNYFLYKHPDLLDALADKRTRFILSLICRKEDISLWNIRQQNKTIQALLTLNFDEIINYPEREWRSSDPEIQRIFRKLRRSPKIREALSIEKCSQYAMREINRCLGHLGLKLHSRWVRIDGEKMRFYKLREKNSELLSYNNICLELTNKRWQLWIDKEINKLQEDLQRNEQNDILQKFSQVIALHSLKTATHNQNILNNSNGKSETIKANVLSKSVTKGRLEFLASKLSRKTFSEGVKIQDDEKKIRDWLNCNPASALKELMSWVEYGREAFEYCIESFGTAIQFQVFGLLQNWLPD